MTVRLPEAGTEGLDRRDLDPAAARAQLTDIARANRRLGGAAAVRFGIAKLIARVSPDLPLTVLDIGAGAGDILQSVQARFDPEGTRLQVVAVDHLRAAAGMCRDRRIPAAVADFTALPVRERSVDIVIVSQVLHHLNRDAVPVFLRRVAALARVGVVVADLRRSAVAAAGLWLTALVFSFDPGARRDGVVSLRRGFQPHELERLLASGGVPAPVRRRWAYRLVAAWETSRAHD
jgi:SAM-dependent methyltransferase